jgi:ring-1,2-phenylacetyl-CoA epoxidase subunit PaaD
MADKGKRSVDITPQEIWEILDEVKDPEIPVVSVVELGLIRSVGVERDRVVVKMSPTFVGCPALQVMQAEIKESLERAGIQEVEVKMTFSPPWSSEWITSAGREKLRQFGLAPPPRHAGDIELALLEEVACPYCESEDTRLTNSFGPTLCRAIYFCNACRQPFEQFKPV